MTKDWLVSSLYGALLVAIGAIAGSQYQLWKTRPRLGIEYVLPNYDVSLELPSDLTKELRGRRNFVETADALVTWPLPQALQLNSWKRRELEELLVLQKPFLQEGMSSLSDLRRVKDTLQGRPTCDSVFEALESVRSISGFEPTEWYTSCVKSPSKAINEMRSLARAGLADGDRYVARLKSLGEFLEQQLHSKSSTGPLVIEVGVTNFGQTEGAFNNRPVLRVISPERIDAVLRVYERPRPWERTSLPREILPSVSPDQPIISVRGQGFVSFPLSVDSIKNSQEVVRTVDQAFARGTSKAVIVFLDAQNRVVLQSSEFPLRPPVE